MNSDFLRKLGYQPVDDTGNDDKDKDRDKSKDKKDSDKDKEV